MTSKYNLDEIRKFWTQQSSEHGGKPEASWSDVTVIQMEIRELLRYLDDGDRVIDIGCANGYTTCHLASQKAVDIVGKDYIPGMIESAKRNAVAMKSKLLGRVSFEVGDITSLTDASNHYDKAMVVRVLINLGTWELQAKGLREALRVVKPGGLLLLSEATLQGWRKLNDFRREWGLDDIPMPPFNEYLDEQKVIEALSPDAELVDIVNFASTYYVASRVFKPLLARMQPGAINTSNPLMEFNAWAGGLPAAGDYGTQKLFVIQKLQRV